MIAFRSFVRLSAQIMKSCFIANDQSCVLILELITYEILAAERLRLMGFDNRLIIDCFANVINILIWLFSTNDRFRNERSQFIVENTSQ